MKYYFCSPSNDFLSTPRDPLEEQSSNSSSSSSHVTPVQCSECTKSFKTATLARQEIEYILPPPKKRQPLPFLLSLSFSFGRPGAAQKGLSITAFKTMLHLLLNISIASRFSEWFCFGTAPAPGKREHNLEFF